MEELGEPVPAITPNGRSSITPFLREVQVKRQDNQASGVAASMYDSVVPVVGKPFLRGYENGPCDMTLPAPGPRGQGAGSRGPVRTRGRELSVNRGFILCRNRCIVCTVGT